MCALQTEDVLGGERASCGVGGAVFDAERTVGWVCEVVAMNSALVALPAHCILSESMSSSLVALPNPEGQVSLIAGVKDDACLRANQSYIHIRPNRMTFHYYFGILREERECG